MSGRATFVKTADGFHGDAAVFRLDPPLENGTEYVVASAIDLPDIGSVFPGYRKSETMCFPATVDGEVTDWGELGFVPYKDHSAALKDMGYEVSA